MEYVLNLFLLVIGLAFLIKGADLFVDGSSSVAKLLKIPTVIIGLTFVSIGTSLPEAAVSISASIKGAYDISIANVVGSNIFNILFILGMSGIVHPLICDVGALIDTVLLILMSLLMFFIYKSKDKVTRPIGYFSVAIYVVYVIYIILRAYGTIPSIF